MYPRLLHLLGHIGIKYPIDPFIPGDLIPFLPILSRYFTPVHEEFCNISRGLLIYQPAAGECGQ